PPPDAGEVARLVELAAAACRGVYPAGCLPRSLAMQRLLARRGAPAELRIGVRRREGVLEAHAWVEVDGRPVGEPEGVEELFAVLEAAGPGSDPA
ncbi:MAG TPA: lasso peptide biosynthesis B2 protein, partial [Thermoanaerobaculia bacterium]|nr:lasso peptide biosynthesis B2 protein [Thermoanaerobaculia bacterium]